MPRYTKNKVNINDQSGLRESLENYLQETGVKSIFIAKKTNICPTVLCHFKKGRMQLPDKQYANLLNYLIEKK